MLTNDTIAAVVTAMGEAAVGIIRLSGSDSCQIADKFFRGRTSLANAPTQIGRASCRERVLCPV